VPADNIIELEGCTDCVMYLANGEVPEDNVDGWSAEAVDAKWQGYHLCVAGEEDSEEYFSWQPCGVCGSTLGGNRYPCAAWKCEEIPDA
jgi:hypothetical protein